MSQFLSPGVYVQEVPSAVQPIAGVGTSTAAFLGVFASPSSVQQDPENVGQGDGRTTSFRLNRYPVNTSAGSFTVTVDGSKLTTGVSLTNDPGRQASFVTFAAAPAAGKTISVTYALQVTQVKGEKVAAVNGEYVLAHYPVNPTAGSFAVRTVTDISKNASIEVATGQTPSATLKLTSAAPDKAKITVTYLIPGDSVTEVFTSNGTDTSFILKNAQASSNGLLVSQSEDVTGTSLVNSDAAKLARVTGAHGTSIEVDYQVLNSSSANLAASGEVKLCTSFTDFKQWFGDFSNDAGQRNLAHAVYGFFLNGGTRCFVVREQTTAALPGTLDKLAAIDEIALVAAPGITDDAVWGAIEAHCKSQTGDRFGIFDAPEAIEASGQLDLTQLSQPTANVMPSYSDYAAFYFPWLEVFDPFSGGRLFVPPSGHMAGIYARVDNSRGVHKAPANETVLGALGLKYPLSKSQQDGLNSQGVNCIRNMNGNIKVWGARTIGGDMNGEWKYLSVRRLFLFLRESIDQGTQWVVFEPNDISLWAKITRNITAFLTTVWRSGALFGNTPQEAFYVRCDASTNPPELRELGQVVTEIGVAVVKPAEFVVFRISQWAGPGQ